MLNKYFRIAVGCFVIISALGAMYHSVNWLWFTLFIGVNMVQSAFTKWCLLEKILIKLGAKPGGEGCSV